MNSILKVTSSVFDTDNASGVSTGLANDLIAGLQAKAGKNTGALQVQERNLATEGIPHLDAAWIKALSTPVAERTADQAAKVAFSDRLISEVQAADILVIAAPMYNFTVPSTLKAWIDHIARAGVTFRYTEQGPVGLLTGKKVYLVTTTGGQHEPGVTDFVRPYLQTALGLLGLNDIHFIHAAGLNMGEQPRAVGLADAAKAVEAAVADHTTLNETGRNSPVGKEVA